LGIDDDRRYPSKGYSPEGDPRSRVAAMRSGATAGHYDRDLVRREASMAMHISAILEQ
jgi:hypothetical protein